MKIESANYLYFRFMNYNGLTNTILRVPLVSFFSLMSLISFAQVKQKDSDLETFEKIDLGINGLNVTVETPLSKKILGEFAIGVGPSYDFHDDDGLTNSMDYHWAILEPSFHASAYGKYYYNREKRLSKGKSLLLNSGNFVGLKVKYVSKSLSSPQFYTNTILANLNWGLQRNIGKHWTYSFSTGLGFGYNMDDSYSMFYPALDLKISYVLPFFDKK